MGSISFANVSIVVAAEDHNPTILHPSFLQTEGIVPGDWEVRDDLICTPAFSSVSYANGIAFRVERNKLQIVDGDPDGDGTNSRIAGLAAHYVEKLPHVRYKAVGVNFVTFSDCENSDEYMVARFLRPGIWNDDELTPISMGVQLAYQITGATLNLSLKPGRSSKQGEEPARVGIVLEGNCHRDTQSTEEVLTSINGFKQKLKDARAICARVLGAAGDE